MRIILDESVPQNLRLLICENHTVVTTLLNVAEEAGFDLFITADQQLSYQQNLRGRRIALLVLSTNNWKMVKAHCAKIEAAISAATPGSYTELDIPYQY